MIPLIIQTIESPNDREFMEELYLRYNRLMYSECMKVLRDTWETEDVMQTAIEKLIHKIPLLKTLTPSKQINYIITTCRNTAKSYLSKKSRQAGYELSEFDGVEVGSNSLEEFVIKKHTIEIVNIAWKSVDEKTRDLLRSKYILQASNEEIAESFCIQPNSVRTYLSRARMNVRNKIEELEG